MDKNTLTAPESDNNLAEDDDKASVDSAQLMADINEFISDSPETVEVEFCESESNMSSCEENKDDRVAADKPSTSNAGPSQVVKSANHSYQSIQLNQPVVILSKLDSHDIAKYLSSRDDDEKMNSKSDSKKAGKLSAMKTSASNDDDDDEGSLSELSVSDFSLSDTEDDKTPVASKLKPVDSKTVPKAKKIAKNGIGEVFKRRSSKEVPISSHTVTSNKTKSILSTSQSKASDNMNSNTSKNTVRFKDNPDNSSKTIKKNSGRESISKPIINQQDKEKENVGKGNESYLKNEDSSKEKINKNWRYELTLTGFNIFEVTNESFRKFINLASDCVMDFAPPIASNKPCEGSVSLYFGDFDAIQSAMQKLGQVAFTSTSNVHGQIVSRQVMPKKGGTGSKDSLDGKWNISNHVQMFFKLHTAWTDKLKQVVHMKDWKKADKRNEIFAKINRVPNLVSKEFLSLLFPFSLNIHPSPNSQNASEKTKSGNSLYNVKIEYASQDLMETVLCCFQDVSVKSPYALLPITKLFIVNVRPKPLPPGHKGIYPSPSQSPHHELSRQGRLFPCKQHLQRHQHQKSKQDHFQQQRSSGGQSGNHIHHQKNHKQHVSGSGEHLPPFASHHDRNRKRPNATDEKVLPSGKKSRHSEPDEKSTPPVGNVKDVKQMAEAQGLDPNNSDVLCILEMQRQLESMQSLMALTPTVAQSSDVPFTEQTETSTEEKEIAEAEQELRESIALRQKQLQELEEKLKVNRKKNQGTKCDNTITGTKDLQSPSSAGAPPPNQNDQPLDFKKPQPKVELAVKADEIRSKITAAVKEPTPLFKKPLFIATQKAPLKAEDCALPLEFGKNVTKVSPKVIERKSSAIDKGRSELVKQGSNRQQGSQGNADLRSRNKNSPQRRNKTSRWSSIDDRDSNVKKVVNDGLLPSPPSGPFEMSRDRRSAWGSDHGRDDKKFQSSGRGVTQTQTRNLGSWDREVQGRVVDSWSHNKKRDKGSEGIYETVHPSKLRGLSPQTLVSYPVAGGIGGVIGTQGSLSAAKGQSGFSQAGNKGLSIIGKLQKEAFGKDVRGGGDLWKERQGQDHNKSEEHSRSGGRLSNFYSYEEENWDEEVSSQYGRDKVNKDNTCSIGRGHRSEGGRGGFAAKTREQKSASAGIRGYQSHSTSHWDEGEEGYGGEMYDNNANFQFEQSKNVSGKGMGGGAGKIKGAHFPQRKYDDEEESYGWEVGDGGSETVKHHYEGRQHTFGSPTASKRQKLDHYYTSDGAMQNKGEWNQDSYSDSGRDGCHGVGRGEGIFRNTATSEYATAVRGSRSGSSTGRESGGVHKDYGGSEWESRRESNLYNVDKGHDDNYGWEDGDDDDNYYEGNNWGFDSKSYGRIDGGKGRGGQGSFARGRGISDRTKNSRRGGGRGVDEMRKSGMNMRGRDGAEMNKAGSMGMRGHGAEKVDNVGGLWGASNIGAGNNSGRLQSGPVDRSEELEFQRHNEGSGYDDFEGQFKIKGGHAQNQRISSRGAYSAGGVDGGNSVHGGRYGGHSGSSSNFGSGHRSNYVRGGAESGKDDYSGGEDIGGHYGKASNRDAEYDSYFTGDNEWPQLQQKGNSFGETRGRGRGNSFGTGDSVVGLGHGDSSDRGGRGRGGSRYGNIRGRGGSSSGSSNSKIGRDYDNYGSSDSGSGDGFGGIASNRGYGRGSDFSRGGHRVGGDRDSSGGVNSGRGGFSGESISGKGRGSFGSGDSGRSRGSFGSSESTTGGGRGDVDNFGRGEIRSHGGSIGRGESSRGRVGGFGSSKSSSGGVVGVRGFISDESSGGRGRGGGFERGESIRGRGSGSRFGSGESSRGRGGGSGFGSGESSRGRGGGSGFGSGESSRGHGGDSGFGSGESSRGRGGGSGFGSGESSRGRGGGSGDSSRGCGESSRGRSGFGSGESSRGRGGGSGESSRGRGGGFGSGESSRGHGGGFGSGESGRGRGGGFGSGESSRGRCGGSGESSRGHGSASGFGIGESRRGRGGGFVSGESSRGRGGGSFVGSGESSRGRGGRGESTSGRGTGRGRGCFNSGGSRDRSQDGDASRFSSKDQGGAVRMPVPSMLSVQNKPGLLGSPPKSNRVGGNDWKGRGFQASTNRGVNFY